MGLGSSGFGKGLMAGKLLAGPLHAGLATPILAEAEPARQVIAQRRLESGRNDE
jgi:hypothetical protein